MKELSSISKKTVAAVPRLQQLLIGVLPEAPVGHDLHSAVLCHSRMSYRPTGGSSSVPSHDTSISSLMRVIERQPRPEEPRDGEAVAPRHLAPSDVFLWLDDGGGSVVRLLPSLWGVDAILME